MEAAIRRLLIIGADGPGALETFYTKAFRRLGLTAVQFNPEASLSWLHRSRIASRLTRGFQHLVVQQAMKAFFLADAQWDAVLIVKGFLVSAEAIRAARGLTRKSAWVCFNPDSPFDNGPATSSRHIRQAIPLFDAYLIWSRSLLNPLLSAGARRAEYLPFGFDPDCHFPPTSVDTNLAGTVSFVGTYDAHRAAVLEGLSDLPIKIFGNDWEKLNSSSPLRKRVTRAALFGEELRRVVASTAASINILRPQNVGAHNMRTFEIPAMGGVLVTNRTAEQNEFFPEGKASVMYGDTAELRRAVEQILAGEKDTAPIRAEARTLSACHSYDSRAQQIVELLNRVRSKAALPMA